MSESLFYLYPATPQDMKQTWSMVIFCFNEVETVTKVTQKVDAVMQAIAADYEIVLVDDGSTDGSAALVEQLPNQFDKVRVVLHGQNRGIGHALRSGYEAARYENVCAVPADGQFDLDELLPHSYIPQQSFVSFYRKENTTYTLARNILSWANRQVNAWLLGIHLWDVNWVKIYKNETLKKMDLEIESSLVESEICAKLLAQGHRVQQVVSQYLPREAGQSKGASWKIVKQAISDTLLLAGVVFRYKHALKKYQAQQTHANPAVGHHLNI
jgi:dolichol-phosphate mannosyltransferase